MKLSELKGRAVVHIDNAEKIGELADLLVDPDSRRVVGISVRHGLFGESRTVPAAQVKSIGADAVTVLGTLQGMAGAPAHTMGPASTGAGEATNAMGEKIPDFRIRLR